jgi:hypothetical protein
MGDEQAALAMVAAGGWGDAARVRGTVRSSQSRLWRETFLRDIHHRLRRDVIAASWPLLARQCWPYSPAYHKMYGVTIVLICELLRPLTSYVMLTKLHLFSSDDSAV